MKHWEEMRNAKREITELKRKCEEIQKKIEQEVIQGNKQPKEV
jgi:hypothetical protein